MVQPLDPELDAAALATCLVRENREVAWALKQLQDSGGRVALYAAGDLAVRIPARLTSFTPEFVEFTGNGEPLADHGLLLRQDVLVVGNLRDIKIQFTTDGAAMAGTRNDPALRCRTPTTLHRIQRRGSHRVRLEPVGLVQLRMKTPDSIAASLPPAQPAAAAEKVGAAGRPAGASVRPGAGAGAGAARAATIVKAAPVTRGGAPARPIVAPAAPVEPPAGETVFAVVDLSTDGVGFRWPPGCEPPSAGTRFGAVWLESPEWDSIACWIEVVRVTICPVTGERVVGCQLGVAPESANALARSLISLQRR